jgi:hypothetical protein
VHGETVSAARQNAFVSIDGLVFFHGTTADAADRARHEGLDRPFLTDCPQRAAYYADCAVEETGGEPVILVVTVPDEGVLRYDGAAMCEPVHADPALRDAAWQRAADAHPEWLHGEMIHVPGRAWRVSWEGVGSVRADATLSVFSDYCGA